MGEPVFGVADGVRVGHSVAEVVPDGAVIGVVGKGGGVGCEVGADCYVGGKGEDWVGGEVGGCVLV